MAMASEHPPVARASSAKVGGSVWSKARKPLVAVAFAAATTALAVAATEGCKSGAATSTATPLADTALAPTPPPAATQIGAVPVATTPSPGAELYRKSYALEAQGKPAEALDAMKQLRSSGANTYFPIARIAWLAYVAGRYPEACDAYREAIKLAPSAIEPRLGLTLPLLALEKWRDLEVASRDVLKLDPNNAVARARLAHANYMVGNYPDAATLYRKLVDDYPAELNHQTGLGWALARMGRGKEGKQLFEQVLAVSPDNPNAQQGMALP